MRFTLSSPASGPLEGLSSRTMSVTHKCTLILFGYSGDYILFLFYSLLQLNDYRAEFSRWWSKEMRAVKFPSQGTVFDYFIDSETKKFTPWSEKMVPFELEPDVSLQVSMKYHLFCLARTTGQVMICDVSFRLRWSTLQRPFV